MVQPIFGDRCGFKVTYFSMTLTSGRYWMTGGGMNVFGSQRTNPKELSAVHHTPWSSLSFIHKCYYVMPWKCSVCERTLKLPNQWHCCVKRELDEVFANKDPKLLFLFDQILSGVFDWEQVQVSATKNCIVFIAAQTFLVIKPMRHQLNIKFYLDREDRSGPVFKIGRYGRHFEHHVRVADMEDVDTRLMSYIRASYQLLRQ